MKEKELKYLMVSIATQLMVQLGAMVFVIQLLVLFHDSAKEISSIIGLLSVIIGVGLANYLASLIYLYINSDSAKKKFGLKGNNIATVLLVTIVPLITYQNLDFLEEKVDATIFYLFGVVSLLIGIVLNFFLNFVSISR
jgi:hypothetical protein